MAQVATFNEIPANTLAGNDLDKLTDMIESLKVLGDKWNALAAAGKPVDPASYTDNDRTAAIAAAHKELKDSKIKIVNLTDVPLEKTVFLGGSRKKRQSKKRKNHKNHNNNQ